MKSLSGKFKFILLNTAVAILLICGIGIYVLMSLDEYTQHGSSIAVPEFYDLTPEEAEAIATHNHLRIQIVDSLYDENAKPGTVVEQYPASEARIKENRLIHLTINARNPEKVIFPNLKNAAYRQTLQTLEARGFKIGKISYVPSEFKNLVITLQHNNRDIEAGSLLSKGSTIDIILGNGNGSNLVYVPQLTGKKLKDALNAARNAYLNIGEIIPDGSMDANSDKSTAIVYNQTPVSNNMVNAGSTINLYITRNKEKIAALDSLIINQ